MQRHATIAAAAILLVAVAGCSKSEPTPGATESAAAATDAPVAAASWTPALPAAGNYEVTSLDGKPVSKVSIAPDYAYTVTPAKGLNEAGVVKLIDGKVCFDASGKDKPNRCYTESVRAADGSFTATNEAGLVENIKPVAQ